MNQFDVGVEASKRVVDAARAEVQARKARKKDRKTVCGRCGSGAVGTKLQTCSRCKAINYCSATCQRDHWKSGHKQECNGFVHPPFAKSFQPFDREDVPWPVDPIFGRGNAEGVGIWATTNGTLSTLLQRAFDPVDNQASSLPPPEGTPAYQRWAGVGANSRNQRAFGPELKKYIGSTLMGFRVVVQNRRQDGRVVAVFPGESELSTHAKLKDNLFPDDLKRAKFTVTPEDLGRVMSIPPWTDYTGLLRVGILEINGVQGPTGRFSGTKEERKDYIPPTRPVGGPWDRIIDWDARSVALGPGDYVVFACQYRIGDGINWKDYPEIMTNSLGITIQACVTEAKAADAAWSTAVRQTLPALRSNRKGAPCFEVTAPWDYDYLEEYFRPYFEQGPDAFTESRYGGRAKSVNEVMTNLVPMALKTMLNSLPASNRAEAVRRFNAMGFDIEEALR